VAYDRFELPLPALILDEYDQIEIEIEKVVGVRSFNVTQQLNPILILEINDTQ
jgi:hypothetical protein